MSDYSTNAMKPKEPPVTAKVVIGATNELLIIERKGRYISVPAQILTREMRDENELYRFLINANRFDSMLSPSEQRYQQLSKLAQDMHRIIASAERNGSTICDGVSARLLERMEGLGVEADG